MCRQGDKSDCIFVLLSGKASVQINGDNVGMLSRGHLIGELGLIDYFRQERKATIKAYYDCEVAIITYDAFLEFHQLMSMRQAQKIADFVAEYALPKYFSMQERALSVARPEPSKNPGGSTTTGRFISSSEKMRSFMWFCGFSNVWCNTFSYLTQVVSARRRYSRGSGLLSPFNRLHRMPSRWGMTYDDRGEQSELNKSASRFVDSILAKVKKYQIIYLQTLPVECTK